MYRRAESGMRGEQKSKKQHDYDDDDGRKILKIMLTDNHFLSRLNQSWHSKQDGSIHRQLVIIYNFFPVQESHNIMKHLSYLYIVSSHLGKKLLKNNNAHFRHGSQVGGS